MDVNPEHNCFKEGHATERAFLQASEDRACRQRAAIAELTLDEAVIAGDLASAFTRLVQVMAATVQVARASIWMLSDDETRLDCQVLFQTASESFSRGQVLQTADFPIYFQAIRTASRIYVYDAQTDPRTSELTTDYLVPLGITSMLDAGIVNNGHLVGVICLEHIGARRQWFSDEEAFASTVATLASQILTNAERRKTLDALMQSEERYRTLFEKAPVGIFQTTPEGRYLSVNPAYARMAGYVSPDEMIAQVTDIARQMYVDPEVRTRYQQILARDGHVNNFEAEYKRRDGGTFWISMNTTLEQDSQERITYNGFLVDITERKRAEQIQARLQAQLLQARKMEAVGTLAGGVAHDFNNLLQAITGYTELILMHKESTDPDYARLQAIEKTVKRGAQLISRLLLFSRKAETQRQPLDLNREVREVVKVLERTIPRMVDIHVQAGPNLWPVNADPIQVEQVLLNMGSNAADAMPQGGQLLIETCNVTLDDAFTSRNMGSRKGQHVLMRVSDTGCGMHPETVEQVFEPFFTTKEVGKGTGLGLASVFGIVKSHDGYIQCYSEINQGTTFNIYWPALPDITASASAEEPCGWRPSLFSETRSTILVVDDIEAIRNTAREALQARGYEVITAANGEEALTIIDHQPIDLVIMDLGMPGMGGLQCLKELLRRKPHTRILIASGYTLAGRSAEVLQSGAAGFISKPYQLTELIKHVQEALAMDNG